MITGRGLNSQITHTYGWLAFHRPGDRIILIGYSRGAFSARCAVEQVRFRGPHGDVGSQVIGPPLSRPLANVPLVRMLERRGLPSPEGWRGCFPCDVLASTWLGWGKLFLLRRALVAPRRLETKEGQQA